MRSVCSLRIVQKQKIIILSFLIPRGNNNKTSHNIKAIKRKIIKRITLNRRIRHQKQIQFHDLPDDSEKHNIFSRWWHFIYTLKNIKINFESQPAPRRAPTCVNIKRLLILRWGSNDGVLNYYNRGAMKAYGMWRGRSDVHKIEIIIDRVRFDESVFIYWLGPRLSVYLREQSVRA